jgi:hypothetical protein
VLGGWTLSFNAAVAVNEPLVPVRTKVVFPVAVLPSAVNVAAWLVPAESVRGNGGVASMPTGGRGIEIVTLPAKPFVGTIEITVAWFAPAAVKVSVLGESCIAKLGEGGGGGPPDVFVEDLPPQDAKRVSQVSTRTETSSFLLGTGKKLLPVEAQHKGYDIAAL